MTETKVLPSADGVARAVAMELVARIAAVQAQGRVPSIVLTGGTIANQIYRAVAALPSGDVDWMQVDFWWGDERYVPADSTDRNDRAAELDLLDVVGVDPARVHAMPAADEAHPDVEAAAAAYASEVREHAADEFDLVLLGVGPDGHVASLFPGSAQLDVTDEVALAVRDSPKPPPERVTLTFPTLNRTHEVWFLVTGEGKADAVARALAESGSVHETPARGITAANRTWWLDEAAAGAL
ncbi:MAG: 6-phosphogluconolactonase [Marmoricola sp.]|nr:6-phosphogluconolactonase [Marmoricola sp.]